MKIGTLTPTLSRESAGEGDSKPFVSVIVPVFNDPRLRACLHSLDAQSYPSDRYEIIVVDNGSEPPVADALRDFPRVCLEREPRPGVSRARLKGVAIASGELLAFTDSDCIPERDWLERGVACLRENPGIGLAGGRIEVFARDPAKMSVGDRLSMAMHLKQDRFVADGWAVLANAFTPRAVVAELGAMNPDLVASGEVEWGRRIGAAGYRVAYAPDAVVRHPTRSTIRQHCDRTVRLEYAWAQLRDVGVGRGLSRWLGQYVRRPLAAIYRDVLRNPNLSGMNRWQVAALALSLMSLRWLAYVLIRAGVRIDVRRRWG